jgi:putative ABC transport system permease protein
VQAQFLIEATVLSILGGLAGVAAGIFASRGVTAVAGWATLVSSHSLLFAFAVAVAIGLFFGFYPARRAARLDPIAARSATSDSEAWLALRRHTRRSGRC